MNKKLILLPLLVALLAACNGGGSSSGGGGTTPAPTVGNFSQLTPNGGVQSSSASALQFTSITPNTYVAFGNNGETVYSSNGAGGLFTANNAYSGWNGITINGQIPANLPLVVISGNGNGVYYVPYHSNVAYNTNGNGFTNGVDAGYITSITSSNNGSTYYGTSLGGVGLVNSPASKTIASINAPGYLASNGSILTVGCTGGSCNSGQQGVLAFQAESNIVPSVAFYPYVVRNYSYASNLYYLDNKGWINTSGFAGHVFSESNVVVINSVIYESVPEFITSVAINSTNSTLYAGTNFFNIYSAPLNCNNGQGCSINWNSATVNSVPLGTVNNGTQGIVSLNVLSSGKLLVVANTSESVTNIYVQN